MAKKIEDKKKTKTKDEKVVKSVKTKNTKTNEKKVKEKEPKKNNFMKFYDFFDKYRLCIYGVIGGVLATILVVILIWPDRIAQLEDGTEPVVEIDGYVMNADELYENMKDYYSVSILLDKIDNKILTEKYEEDDKMSADVEEQAENYYNMYEQYYGIDKSTFLTNNGFGSEKAFLEYLKLQYRRSKCLEDYAKGLVTDSEIEKYYEEEVFGAINTKHILVKVDSSASDEELAEAKSLAEEIISKLDAGSTFDEVKEEYKDSITYEELGYKLNGELESAYEDEMKNLSNESYSKTPVRTSYGYHIVYRIDQKEKEALEDIREDIISSLADAKIAEDANIQYIALDKMRADAGFKFYDTVLEDKYNTYMSQYK